MNRPDDHIAGLHGGTASAAAGLLAVAGALAVACVVKVCGVVFLGSPRSPAAAAEPNRGGRRGRRHETMPF